MSARRAGSTAADGSLWARCFANAAPTETSRHLAAGARSLSLDHDGSRLARRRRCRDPVSGALQDISLPPPRLLLLGVRSPNAFVIGPASRGQTRRLKDYLARQSGDAVRWPFGANIARSRSFHGRSSYSAERDPLRGIVQGRRLHGLTLAALDGGWTRCDCAGLGAGSRALADAPLARARRMYGQRGLTRGAGSRTPRLSTIGSPEGRGPSYGLETPRTDDRWLGSPSVATLSDLGPRVGVPGFFSPHGVRLPNHERPSYRHARTLS